MEPLRMSCCSVDLDLGRVTRDGAESPLTTKEVELLRYLSENPGRTLPREELYVEVWDYSAGAVSRTLDATVKRLRKKVEEDARNPRHILTVYGVGYRFHPARAEEINHGNLTAPRSAFVGRTREIEGLRNGLASSRILGVHGPPGSGKTALIRHVAWADRESWDGGAWLCDLTDAVSDEGVLAVVCGALGIPQPTLEAAGRALAGRGSVLVVLDGADRVHDWLEQRLPELSEAAPEARFAVTSHERLVCAQSRVDLGPLSVVDAKALFVDRASAARSGYAPTGRDKEAVEEIAELLDGLPLAIELAAARMGTLSAVQVRDRLSSRSGLLQSVPGDAVRRVFEELTDDGREVLARCSVFRGSFSASAALRVAGPEAIEAIHQLYQRSLLHRIDSVDLPDEPRFGMYRSIAALAGEQLELAGLVAETEARHTAWALEMGEATAAATVGPTRFDALARLAAETENLLAAHARATDMPTQARLLLAVEPILFLQTPLASVVKRLHRALSQVTDDALRSRVLARRGRALLAAGRSEDARRDLMESIALQGDSDSPTALLSSLQVAMTWWTQGKHAYAVEEVESALEKARAADDRWTEGVILSVVGPIYREVDRESDGVDALFEALAIAREHADLRTEVRALAGLGMLFGDRGQWEEAEAYIRETIPLYRQMRNPRSVAIATGNLAIVHIERESWEDAEATLDESLRLHRQVGNRRGEGIVLLNLGILCHIDTRSVEAETHYRHALRLMRAVPNRQFESKLLALLGALQADLGRVADAERSFEAAAAVLTEIDAPESKAMLQVCLGHLDLARGEVAAARARVAAAESRHNAARLARLLLGRVLSRS